MRSRSRVMTLRWLLAFAVSVIGCGGAVEASGGVAPDASTASIASDCPGGSRVGGGCLLQISGDPNPGYGEPVADATGAIVADGTHVFWVQLGGDSGSTAPNQLLSCPVLGCGTPTPLYSGVLGGSGETDTGAVGQGEGELALAGGRIFFFEADESQRSGSAGAILSCPTTGCGDGPVTFTRVANASGYTAAIAADATNIYWADSSRVYSCPIADTCTSPVVLTTRSGGVSTEQIVVAGGSLYWANVTGGFNAPSFSAEIDSVPIAGGLHSTLCKMDLSILPSLAVVGDYVYATGGEGGTVRCPTMGGVGTAISTDTDVAGAYDVATDGAALFFLSGATSSVFICVPGATCDSPLQIVTGNSDSTGIAVNDGNVYGANSYGLNARVWALLR